MGEDNETPVDSESEAMKSNRDRIDLYGVHMYAHVYAPHRHIETLDRVFSLQLHSVITCVVCFCYYCYYHFQFQCCNWPENGWKSNLFFIRCNTYN